MAFDLDMIKGIYAPMQERVEVAIKVLGRPLTLTGSILDSRLNEGASSRVSERQRTYLCLLPIQVRRYE